MRKNLITSMQRWKKKSDAHINSRITESPATMGAHIVHLSKTSTLTHNEQEKNASFIFPII